MIKLNDVTDNVLATNFGGLEVGDYFIQSPTVIWMKTNEYNIIPTDEIDKTVGNAIQITNNGDYVRYGLFRNDSIVEKIKITSIDYIRIK